MPLIQQIDNDRYIPIFKNLFYYIYIHWKLFRAKQVKENRKRLIPIIQCVILCGQEDIPLRGHRDFGSFNIEG